MVTTVLVVLAGPMAISAFAASGVSVEEAIDVIVGAGPQESETVEHDAPGSEPRATSAPPLPDERERFSGGDGRDGAAAVPRSARAAAPAPDEESPAPAPVSSPPALAEPAESPAPVASDPPEDPVEPAAPADPSDDIKDGLDDALDDALDEADEVAGGGLNGVLP